MLDLYHNNQTRSSDNSPSKCKKYYNVSSVLFYVVGRGALHSVAYLNFTGRCPGPPSNLYLAAPSFSSFGLILSIALANLSLVVIIIDTSIYPI